MRSIRASLPFSFVALCFAALCPPHLGLGPALAVLPPEVLTRAIAFLPLALVYTAASTTGSRRTARVWPLIRPHAE